MVALLFHIFKTARPRQWVKNLTLFAALIFTGYIYSPAVWWVDFGKVIEAVAAFTVVAGSVYFFNDIIDIGADKAHPFKSKRPIASGKIPLWMAWTIFGIGSLTGLVWTKGISELFFWATLGYWVMQIAYSLWLKNVEVVDVLIIAMGFFIRVLAGALVINGHLSIWFLLCVISVSVFLAVGKRRAELAILTEQGAVQHRKVMGKYTVNILDTYLAMFATAAFLSWALYTFNFYEQTGLQTTPTSLALVSRTLTINKWLMATIPVVIFGIMRYVRIIYDGSRAESPERVILSDLPLLTAVGVWGAMVIVVLYWLPQ